MNICIDADGTLFTHEFPAIGKDIGAVPVLRKLLAAGHKLILFTMRSEEYLIDVLDWSNERGITWWGVNRNPEQHKWTSSPKAYGELYIDDAALGVPLTINTELSMRPFVDWEVVEQMLVDFKII